MTSDVDRELSAKYCQRFGKIAVELGFVTPEKVKNAMSEQMDDNIAGRTHRLLGRILLEHGWISAKQIDVVLNELFRKESAGEESSN